MIQELRAREIPLSRLADRFRGAHRIERARHELSRTRSIQVVGGFRLEQLGVRKDDPELVVQAMEQQP